jgi:Capsule polysaccharide biosynthesis protein
MNILLLSNGAPGYHRFFNKLAQRFHEDGNGVIVAVDSEFSRAENKLNALNFPVHEFSSFFSRHELNHSILKRYAKYNINSALLSDFERAEVYEVWGKRSGEFFTKLKSALLSFFEEIVSKNKVNVVLYENVSNAFAHFAYFVCKENDIYYCGIGGSRLPGRFSITSDPLNDHVQIEKLTNKIQAGEIVVKSNVREWCKNYLDNIDTITPDYMKSNGLDNTNIFSKYFNVEKIKKIGRAIKHIKDDHYHSFQIGNPINMSWNMFKRACARKLRTIILPGKYDTARPGERFLLYPMHFHPESSTSILAGSYLNEYEVLRNIAFNLPQGVMLYVKDHISAWGYPSFGFYEKILSLPNVRLLPPTAPTKHLIRNSEAVITLTSTVGYEALLLNKRVFLFGNVFYKSHPGVIQINNTSKLFDLFKIELDKDIDFDRSYNLDFLAGYYLSTQPGALNHMVKDKDSATLVQQLYVSIKKNVMQALAEKSNPNTNRDFEVLDQDQRFSLELANAATNRDADCYSQ